ncbi:MAG: exodeoxyribonuclease VII small subunit [Planctomycetia bacterium]
MPFETSLAELNDLVNRLESGALGLSESIGAYERGVSILRRLHEQLADVEERVRLLVRIDEQGRPILEPIQETTETDKAVPSNATAAAAAATSQTSETSGPRGPRPVARAQARPGRVKRLPGMDDAGEDG